MKILVFLLVLALFLLCCSGNRRCPYCRKNCTMSVALTKELLQTQSLITVGQCDINSCKLGRRSIDERWSPHNITKDLFTSGPSSSIPQDTNMNINPSGNMQPISSGGQTINQDSSMKIARVIPPDTTFYTTPISTFISNISSNSTLFSTSMPMDADKFSTVASLECDALCQQRRLSSSGTQTSDNMKASLLFTILAVIFT